MRLSMTLVVCAVLAAAVVSTRAAQADEPVTIRIDPRATYLHLGPSDDGLAAVPIVLADLGISGGDLILLEQLGDFSYSVYVPFPDDATPMVGVFSASGVLLAPSLLNRVQNAIDAGEDTVTQSTFFGDEPTDIPEDFFIPGSLVIEVPPSATHLFVAAPDSFWGDNADPDGDFAVRITNLSRVYDSFKGRFINTAKWRATPICSNSHTFDCARELSTGRLRLAARTYGDAGSNNGVQFDESALRFPNPNEVTAITAKLRIRQATAVGCGANPEASTTHAILGGRFFNTGTSGNPEEDIEALLLIDRRSDANLPAHTLNVVGFLFGCPSPGCTQREFFGFANLGTVILDQPFSVSVQWDSQNNRFVFGLKKPGSPAVRQPSSYPLPAIAPPAFPDKFLGLRTFGANCTNTDSVAGMEATMDKVVVNSPPEE